MKNILILFIALGLAACVKDDLSTTSHPETAGVTFTLTGGGTGSSFILVSDDGQEFDLSSGVPIDEIAPGDRTFLIYSAGFTVSNGVLGVGTNPAPKVAYAGSIGATDLQADRDYELSVALKPLMRQVNLTITDNGSSSARLAGITASLSGVASSVVLATGAASGNATTMTPLTFAATDTGKKTWKFEAQLIDLFGSTQNLTITLGYTDGTRETLTPENIYAKLTAGGIFNSNKAAPINLSTTITTSISPEIDAEITPWEVIDGTGEVNEQ